MSQQSQVKKQIEAALIAKAQTEPAFRQALLKNSKAAIEKEFGVKLPAGAELKVVEETATTNYLVLPASAEGELSDADLEKVAGGWIALFGAMAAAKGKETLSSSVSKKDDDTKNAVIGKIG